MARNSTLKKRDFSQDQLSRLEEQGMTLPGGAYPIETVEDLRNAIRAIGRAKDRKATVRHILRQAERLDAMDEVPDWMRGESKASQVSISEGDFVRWDSSGGKAQGRVEHVMTEGVLGVPNSSFKINASEEDPALLIRIYRKGSDGWEETETLVGHKSSTVSSIAPLAEEEKGYPKGDASRVDVPAWMAANAKRGIDWYVARSGGNTGVVDKTLDEARQMARGSVTVDKAKRMYAWFARHMVDLDAPAADRDHEDYPSAGVVAHALWGGMDKEQSKRAMEWAKAIRDKANAAEEKSLVEWKSTGVVEHKTVPVCGVKVLDEESGLVETIVSVTGIVDGVKDVIEPGAYEKTLAERTPKGVWGHDWNTPISRTELVEELMPGDPRLPSIDRKGDPWPAGAGALLVQTRFNLETQRGREAYSDVKFFGDQQEWSIGYNVPVGGAKVEAKTGVRRIQSLDLFEYSPVLFGAMPEAVTQSVKSAQEALQAVREVEMREHEVVDEVMEWFEDARDEIEAEVSEFEAAQSEEKRATPRRSRRGNAETLRRYWAEGEGAAKIRWGQEGDFDRCVSQVEKYMPGRAEGYCNLLHHRALGIWPAQHAGTKSEKEADVTGKLYTPGVAKILREIADQIEGGKVDDKLVSAASEMLESLSETDSEREVGETEKKKSGCSNPPCEKAGPYDCKSCSWRIEEKVDDPSLPMCEHCGARVKMVDGKCPECGYLQDQVDITPELMKAAMLGVETIGEEKGGVRVPGSRWGRGGWIWQGDWRNPSGSVPRPSASAPERVPASRRLREARGRVSFRTRDGETVSFDAGDQKPPKPSSGSDSTYGLNDPSSPRYIRDQGQRVRAAAELQQTAQNLGTTPEDVLRSTDSPVAKLTGASHQLQAERWDPDGTRGWRRASGYMGDNGWFRHSSYPGVDIHEADGEVTYLGLPLRGLPEMENLQDLNSFLERAKESGFDFEANSKRNAEDEDWGATLSRAAALSDSAPGRDRSPMASGNTFVPSVGEFDSYGDATESTLQGAVRNERLPEGWRAEVVPGSSSEPPMVRLVAPSGDRMANDERTMGVMLTQDGRWEWGGSRGYTSGSLSEYIESNLGPKRVDFGWQEDPKTGEATGETLQRALASQKLPKGWTAQVVDENGKPWKPGGKNPTISVSPTTPNPYGDDERAGTILLTEDGKFEWAGSRGYYSNSLEEYIQDYLTPRSPQRADSGFDERTGDPTGEKLKEVLSSQKLPKGWSAEVVNTYGKPWKPGEENPSIRLRPPASYPGGEDDERIASGIVIRPDGKFEWVGSRGYVYDDLDEYIESYVPLSVRKPANPGAQRDEYPADGLVRRNGAVILDDEVRDETETLANILDVDNSMGSWASGMRDWQFDALAEGLSTGTSPEGDLEIQGSRYEDSLSRLWRVADDLGVDPADVLDFRRGSMKLGWSLEEQMMAVLRGESLDEQNPQALRQIMEFLNTQNMPGAVEAADAIRNYLFDVKD